MSSPVQNIPTNEFIDPNTVIVIEKEPLYRTFQRARPTTGWQNFFSGMSNVLNAMTSSGTTAQRPTKGLFTGRMYFDTTLGLPIWYKTAGWVKADGTAA